MEKRIYRSRKERMIGGVAGGIAEYFDVDPVVVRFAFIALTLFNGVGVVLYIVGMIIIPEQVLNPDVFSESSVPGAMAMETPGNEKRGRFSIILGLSLIIAGVLFGMHNFIPEFDIIDAFPVLLVLLGIWIIVSGKRRPYGD